MFWIFALLSLIMFVEAVLTFLQAVRFRDFFLRQIKDVQEIAGHMPKVALLAPFKGIDSDMEENIRSWCALDYPDFKIFFIVESDQDPAAPLLRNFSQGRLLIAGESTDSGQKVHNLRYAIRNVPLDYEVFAFVDSDCSLKSDWLRNLIRQVVIDPDNAATGYRWFTNTANFGSMIRSAWNSSVLTLYRPMGANNFAWGGATAIFRKTFESSSVFDFWNGSISDDYSLTNALKSSGRKVNFVPGSLAFTRDSISFGQFLTWAFRQLLITRIYYPRLWTAAFVFHCAWFSWILTGFFFPLYFLIIFLVVQILQSIKADLRWQCIRSTAETSFLQRVQFWMMGPLIGVCNFLLLLSTIFTRTVTWRNVKYVLLGSDRLIIHHR